MEGGHHVVSPLASSSNILSSCYIIIVWLRLEEDHVRPAELDKADFLT